MGIDLSVMDKMMPKAVQHFWRARRAASKSQKSRGVTDQGNRSGVTAGKNLDGFVKMVRDIIAANGVKKSDIYTTGRRDLTIPGFYRPTKNWDLLVVTQSQLVAAIEFKSQVGPSFGNNFNNRVEEALGNATDIATAFREGAFGESGRPFLGYFFVLEECDASTKPVEFTSQHFPVLPEFIETSYAARYELLCRKLTQEQLYDAAAVIYTNQEDAKTGTYRTASDLTSPHRFAASLAGKIASISGDR